MEWNGMEWNGIESINRSLSIFQRGFVDTIIIIFFIAILFRVVPYYSVPYYFAATQQFGQDDCKRCSNKTIMEYSWMSSSSLLSFLLLLLLLFSLLSAEQQQQQQLFEARHTVFSNHHRRHPMTWSSHRHLIIISIICNLSYPPIFLPTAEVEIAAPVMLLSLLSNQKLRYDCQEQKSRYCGCRCCRIGSDCGRKQNGRSRGCKSNQNQKPSSQSGGAVVVIEFQKQEMLFYVLSQ